MNLGAPIRTAILASAAIAPQLGVWQGEPSVHTRDPAPDDAPYPMIICSEEVAVRDEDGLTSRRPVVTRDIRIYGTKPDHDRLVQSLGWEVRELFHRQRFAITVDGYQVVDIDCLGPMPAPTDDEEIVGRIITLGIRLRRLAA